MNMNKKIKAKDAKKSKKEEVENDAQEITEISADLALKASKKAEVERGKAAVAGNKEKAVQICLNRFDDETKESFWSLYTKLDDTVDTENVTES